MDKRRGRRYNLKIRLLGYGFKTTGSKNDINQDVMPYQQMKLAIVSLVKMDIQIINQKNDIDTWILNSVNWLWQFFYFGFTKEVTCAHQGILEKSKKIEEIRFWDIT